MWTSTIDLKLNRILLTQFLGLVYPDIYYSSLSPLRVTNIPRSTLPAANWVRVRNRLAGISSSDIHLVHVDTDARTAVAALPSYQRIYPGSELIGEVIEIGEDVQHLNVGDRVVLQYRPNCLSTAAQPVCPFCAQGDYNLCEFGTLPGPLPIGGGWSEEMLLHEQQLFRLPTNVSDEQGVMLEPAAIALHAVLRHLPQQNEQVLIVGAGTTGLLTLQILRALVPEVHISILARYPFQIEQATRLGADHIIYPSDPYTSVQHATQSHMYKGLLNNRTLVGGFDTIYETIGERKSLHHALRWLRTRGTIVLADLNPRLMNIDFTPLWSQEINLLGSFSHGVENQPVPGTKQDNKATPRSTFALVTELLTQKRIQPEQLITHRFALNNYKEALHTTQYEKKHQAIKVIFDYALLPMSTVPNVPSARSLRPDLIQPQGDVFLQEFLKAQSEPGKYEDERVPQGHANKIVDPSMSINSTRETWRSSQQNSTQQPVDTALDQEDEADITDPAIPVVKRPAYNLSVSDEQETKLSPSGATQLTAQPAATFAQIPTTPPIETSANGEETLHLAHFSVEPLPVTNPPMEIRPEHETDESTDNRTTLQTQETEEDLPDFLKNLTPFESTYFPPTTLPAPFDIEQLPFATPIGAQDLIAPIDIAQLPFSEAVGPQDLIAPIDVTQFFNTLTSEQDLTTPINVAQLAFSEPVGPQDLIAPIDIAQLSFDTPTQPPAFSLPPDVEQLSFDQPVEPQTLSTPTSTIETSITVENPSNTHVTEEQLPTSTVLDNLFDTDTSSMPAFLAQLSDFDTGEAIPEPVVEAPVSTPAASEEAQLITPEEPGAPQQVEADVASNAPKAATKGKKRNS